MEETQTMSITRRTFGRIAAGLMAATTFGLPAFAADMPAPFNEPGKVKIALVRYLSTGDFFQSYLSGVEAQAKALGVDLRVLDSRQDAALQADMVDQAIALGVNGIIIQHGLTESMKEAAQRAVDAGIKVVAHEGPGLKNKDWDFELASAKGFGEAHAELLAKTMGGKGEYAVYVGSLTVPLHNAWADAAIAYLKDKYPDMKPVGERYGVAENVDDSRKTALDLIAAHPNLHGFLAFGSQGPIGAGRAIEEKNQVGKIFVVGPFSPGQGRKLIKEGAILGGFMWNPAEAGRVFVRVGKMLAEGQEIKDGTTIEGLGVVKPDAATHNIITDNLLQINKQTVDKLADLGL